MTTPEVMALARGTSESMSTVHASMLNIRALELPVPTDSGRSAEASNASQYPLRESRNEPGNESSEHDATLGGELLNDPHLSSSASAPDRPDTSSTTQALETPTARSGEDESNTSANASLDTQLKKHLDAYIATKIAKLQLETTRYESALQTARETYRQEIRTELRDEI